MRGRPPGRPPRRRWGLPPFRSRRRMVGSGRAGARRGRDRGGDVGPGRAPGAVAGVDAARPPGRRDRGRGRRRPRRGPTHGGRGPELRGRRARPDRGRARQRSGVRPGTSAKQVAALPGVTKVYPFMVGVATQVLSPQRLGGGDASLFPVAPASMPILTGPLVAGRLPDPARADEIVVDENTRDRFDLDHRIDDGARSDPRGSRPGAPGVRTARHASSRSDRMLRVVGIAKSVSSDRRWMPSSGFYAKYGSHMPQIVNVFVDLRGGRGRSRAFTDRGRRDPRAPGQRRGHQRSLRHPQGEERHRPRARRTAAVRAGRAPRRRRARRARRWCGRCRPARPTSPPGGRSAPTAAWPGGALVLPPVLTAIVAVATHVHRSRFALSSRFPLGTARDYDLDVGTHVDWVVLGLAVLAVLVGVMTVAAGAAWWRVNRRASESTVARRSSTGSWHR